MSAKLAWYADQINKVLTRRRVIDSPLTWKAWAELGNTPPAYALVVDLSRFPGKALERLYDSRVIHDISTILGGLKVGYTNSQGFAFVVKEERVPELEPVVLLDEIKAVDCVLIVAGRGKGKTNLLQHRVKNYAGTIIILDPKPVGENVWERGIVFGSGFNWPEIETKTADLVRWMDHRLRNGYDKPALIVIDEFYRIIKNNPDVARRVFDDLLVSGRTAGIDVVCATHSERVKGLGIEGLGDLIENFDAIVRMSKIRQTYRATIDFGEGPIPAQPPGPFFSEIDRIIARFAIDQNDGVCTIRTIAELAKNHPAIRRKWGSEFGKYRLEKRLADWESRGWLLPSIRDPQTGLPTGRRVSQALIDLSGG